MNLSVLIVDDSPEKIREIAGVIRSSGAYPEPEIHTAGDLYNARKAMRGQRFDLVILDANLPPRPGDPASPNDCDGFLSDVGQARRMKKPLSLIGITAFDILYDKLNSVFAAHGWLLFHTQFHADTWPKIINERLRFLHEQRKNVVSDIADYDLDCAIVTALATPELAAVLQWPVDWKIFKAPDDFVEYHLGQIEEGQRTVRFVAASCQQMGLVSASTLSLKLCRLFRPRLLVMAGIAAGVRGSANIGDLLVAEESWDYNSGKLGKADAKRTFTPDPKAIRVAPETGAVFQNPKRNAKYTESAFIRWRGPLPAERPRLLVGPVASGSSVVADPDKVAEILRHNRKLIGLEMETYGVYFAALNTWAPKPRYLSLKAVCDFADETKTDGFQAYAAHMSAQVLLNFILGGLFE